MKKLERMKTLQLIVFFLIAVLCIYIIIIKSDTYYQIAESQELQTLVVLLWVSLFVTFLFIFIDFTMFARQKSDFNALDYAVHSDPLAKIANRQGCDEIIEKYIDQPLPNDMGVVMFLLTSLNDINRHHNRLMGNKQIRNFSIILKLASTDICFVGRNGGNVFMAIFEQNANENLNIFLSRIEEKVLEYNHDKESLPMYYTLGSSLNHDDPERTINGLISQANKRAHESDVYPPGVVTITDMLDEQQSAQVVKTDIITKEDPEYEKVASHDDEPKEAPAESKGTAIPAFAVAARILDVAKVAVTGAITITEDEEESISYSYTEEEKFGPRTEKDSYVIVAFREAV